MKEKHPTVIVIGAGMAGIMATRTLHEAGVNVICLEARDRIGGRTHTNNELGVSADLGAAWIHGPIGNPMMPLAEKYGLYYGETDFLNHSRTAVQAYDADGTPLNMEEYSQGHALGKAAFIKMNASAIYDAPVAPKTLKDVIEHGLPLREQLDTRSKELGFHYWTVIRSEYSDAADWDTITWELDDTYMHLPGDDLLLWGGGFNAISDQLAEGLDIRTNTAVYEIAHSADGIVVQTAAGEMRCDKAIVTVPLGVLKAGDIAFVPKLSAEKQAAIDRVGFGNYEKLVMRFDKFYWPKNRQRFNYLSDAKDGEPPLFHAWLNLGHYSGEPVIVAYHAGRRARHINQWGDGELLERALDVMQRLFGDEFGDIPPPQQIVRTNWQADQFAHGSYSFDKIGQRNGDRKLLAQPQDDRLFFAGEATHTHFNATVHGAYESGIRAAREVNCDNTQRYSIIGTLLQA